MKTASARSVRSRSIKTSDPARLTPAPSAYSRLVGGQIVKGESAESSDATHRLGPRQSLLRLTLVRGYGHEEGARRFAALEQIRERLQLAAQRDAQRRGLTRALATFTAWYRGHLYGPRSEGQQLLPESLLLQAVDTLHAALEQDPLMSRPIDSRFKQTTQRQRRKDADRARQAVLAWGIGKRHADEILKCVGLSERQR
jgi:hypothetical protein